MQQGDVLLFQTADGGEITINNGIMEMTGGFESQAYLCLFGGNLQDDGTVGNLLTWWSNFNEPNPIFQYVSETQFLLRNIAAIPANLIQIEDAVKRDLKVFLDTNAASSVEVEASIPDLNTIKLVILIEAIGIEQSFTFVENWKSMAA